MNTLQSLSQIFQNRLFRIPDYQRGYAWLETQLVDFWEDLTNLQPDRNHYTGLLSIKPMPREQIDEKDRWLLQTGYQPYHVIDGQQRMTTFVILLNELLLYTRNLPENEGKSDTDIYLGYDSLHSIKEKYISRVCPPTGIVTTYIFSYENDNPSAEYLKYRVFLAEHAGTVHETYYTRNLKRAKEYFAQKIDELCKQEGTDSIRELFLKLTTHLMFNIHEIDDDYDVFVAFETMNNRGKKLTNLELLKNRLIYLTTLYKPSVLPQDQANALREQINDAWKEIYYQLGRNEDEPLSDDDFLRAHWIMYFAYTRRRGDDYIHYLLNKFSHRAIYENAVPQPFTEGETTEASDKYEDDDAEMASDDVAAADSSPLSPKEIASYVNSLKEIVQYWYYSFFPDQMKELSSEERLWIDRLNRLGIGYFRPIVAVSLLPRFRKADRIELLKAVERFLFINFRLAVYQSSYKSSDYYRKTRMLYFGEVSLPAITADLNAVTDRNAVPSDALQLFLSRMNNRFNTADGFYSWHELRYLLFEYELTLAEKYKIQKLEWAVLSRVVKDKVSVEHILPQTPTKYYWQNQFRQFTSEEKRILAASLGNLLPLSRSINSSLQNDGFEDKKKRAYTNGCHSEIEVAQEKDWTAEKIYERGMKLLSFMERRWGFRFGDGQKEELLHIGFIHDGREIPPEIEQVPETRPRKESEHGETKSEHVANLILNWARKKDKEGKLHLDLSKSGRRGSHFTTDGVSAILPPNTEKNSAWNTQHYYYFEIENSFGKSIYTQFTVCSKNMSSEILSKCERINEAFPSNHPEKDWTWRVHFKTERFYITESVTDEQIVNYLEVSYIELQKFEERLVKLFE